MKFIVVSCILFFSLSSSGQDLTDLVLQAGQLFQKGEYEKAIPIAEKAATEVQKLLGRDNMIYQGMITVQAYSYSKIFQYRKAESLYIQLCELHKTSSSAESKQYYATCLNNLATLYTDMGLYEKAEPLFIQSSDITKQLFGENDSTYAYNLNNLAGLYQSMGQYQKAEPLYIRAKEVRKKIYGENHPSYATSMNNLGTLYLEMGQTEKAEPLFIQAKEIWKKKWGESNVDYAMALNNLGSLYDEMEQYQKAETLYNQSREIRKRIQGESHPDYAMCLNNLASMYAKINQYKKSEALLIQAKDTWKNVLGENHPNYATSVNNLAALYRKSQSHYEEAEILYKQAIGLRKKILGTAHPLCSDSENDLALLYSNMRQYAKAEPYLISSSQHYLQNILNTFTILSEKEKSNYLNYNFFITETHNSFLYNYPAASPELKKNSLDLLLGFKSLALSDTRNMLESVRNSSDTVIKRVFATWQTNKVLLTKQYTLPVSSRMKELKKTEEETESLEKELNRRSSAFRNQQFALKVSTENIRTKLDPDEAAIEFVRFRLYKSSWSDSVIYAAYILRKNDSLPFFIPLFEEKQLDKLCEKKGKSATILAKSFYTGVDSVKRTNPTPGDSLYKLVWQPLEPYLEGVKKISYSPAGKLFGIAFLALPCENNQLLVDKYQLQQYASTRQIALRTKENLIKPGDIVLFGNPSFTMDSAGIAKQRRSQLLSVPIPEDRGTRGMLWQELPGTAEEIKIINDLFIRNSIKTRIFTQTEASEENLKALGNRAPHILHIATHGFFLPEPEKKAKSNKPDEGISYKLATDPLLRSGLILAGGNYAWSGKIPIEGVEDGVVTAYEIAQLNLSRTTLVSLSACETGLGDIKGSEGVFGLQRSFKMAGVNKILVSLWQVPDKETVELMTSFYSYWLRGKDIPASFYQAQADMRKKYAPYYWAAFVLVE